MENEFMMFIAAAHETLKQIAPNHDPLRGHTIGTATAGSSVFDNDIKDMDTLSDKMVSWANAKVILDLDVGPGKAGAICISYTLVEDLTIGYASESSPLPDEEYTIKRDHGDLIPSGKVCVTTKRTGALTFVLTPERVGTELEYALASVYPGFPDKQGDWTDLKEGDVVRGVELIRRGISRVKNII